MALCKPAISMAGVDEVQALHRTALKVLANVGMKVHHPAMVVDLQRAGCSAIDDVVRFPEELVQESLEQAGQQHEWYGRTYERKARFGYGDQNFLSSAGQYMIVDPLARTRREPQTTDLRRSIQLGHMLSDIDIVGPLVLPTDVPTPIRDLVVYHELVQHTTKPCFTWIHTGASASYVLEMFNTLAGGWDNLRKKPLVTAFVEAVSPLQYTVESVEVLRAFAQRGLPIGFGPMVMTMATGPGTLAGTLVQEHAEILGGIVMAQVVRPGVPVCYWGIPHVMDPTTGGISFGSPEQALLAATATALGRSCGLPVGTNVGLTDAKLPDAQAGLEKGMTVVMGALGGADIFGHMGISGADQGACLAQLVIDNEMARYVRRLRRGFAVDEETLALDVIERTGIGEQYWMDPHTLRHFRTEIAPSGLLDRLGWAAWKDGGSRDLLQRASDYQNERINAYQQPPMDPVVARELTNLVERARRELL